MFYCLTTKLCSAETGESPPGLLCWENNATDCEESHWMCIPLVPTFPPYTSALKNYSKKKKNMGELIDQLHFGTFWWNIIWFQNLPPWLALQLFEKQPHIGLEPVSDAFCNFEMAIWQMRLKKEDGLVESLLLDGWSWKWSSFRESWHLENAQPMFLFCLREKDCFCPEDSWALRTVV